MRMSSVTSRPSSSTRSPTSIRTPSAIAAASSSRPAAASATARYIAPVSRYVNPSRSATARATVDLPAPAGPSMAITMASEARRCGLRARARPGRNARCAASPCLAVLALGLLRRAAGARRRSRCGDGTTAFVDGELRIFGIHYRTPDECGFDEYACLGRRRPLERRRRRLDDGVRLRA